MSKGTILIVEDQPGFRRIYHDVLKNDGYEVLEAQDGEQGLEMVNAHKPHLILLDLGLPKIDGFEVLKRVRANPATAKIPVIIFSVLGEQKDVKKGLELGANDYTVKGFYTPRQILSKVRGLITQSEVPKPHHSYKLKMETTHEDASLLQTEIGLAKGFLCPHCGKEMLLELFPDYVKNEGHWFTAHFTCGSCGKTF
ncbi:MAG TPA: response regulator [bacterium]|nr:response regulator [bacterium]